MGWSVIENREGGDDEDWTLCLHQARAPRGNANAAPKFVVDPNWPKPLPNFWLVGQVAGIAVDSRDHIWIIQRQSTLTEDEWGRELVPRRSECWLRTPAAMEFDADGNLIQACGCRFPIRSDDLVS